MHSRNQRWAFDWQIARGSLALEKEKVVRLFQWLEQRRIDKTVLQRSYYYGDSQNDQFVMKEVGMPVAVDPDKNLSSISGKKPMENRFLDRIKKVISADKKSNFCE